MTRSYIDINGWLKNFERQVRLEGDEERARLLELYHRALNLRFKHPENALALFRQGADLARQFNEPCMELFHEFYAGETLMTFLIREKEGLELATRIVTKAGQPQYLRCPTRCYAYLLLIKAYYGMDVIGYAPEIFDMIEFMEREIALDKDTHCRLQGYRVRVGFQIDQHEQAEKDALKYLELAQVTGHTADAYYLLIMLADHLEKEDDILKYAALRGEMALKTREMVNYSMSLLWQAVILRKRKEEADAQRLFMQGLAQFSTLGITRNREYYNLISRFYEAGEEYEKALALREEQIRAIQDYGDYHWLWSTHLKRCKLLKQMNRLTPADIEAAKAIVLKHLKNPQKALKELSEIEQ